MLACVLLGTYAALIIALDQPRVQAYLADGVEEQLETILGSEVNIDHISIGLFNAVELHGVTLYDKAHKEMLQSKLIYGKVRISSLLKGKIYLRNISVLDATFKLYKPTADGEANFKFVIDAFKSKKKEKKPTDLSINSLLLRRCQVAYDEEYQPYPADNRFTPHHIFLRDVNANLSLKQLTDNDIRLRIRQLSLAEQSGFKIDNLHLRLNADRKHADIRDLDITLPNTHLVQDELSVDYDLGDLKSFFNTVRLTGQFDDVRVSTKDITAFVPALKGVDETIIASTQLQLNNRQIALRDLHIHNAAQTFELSGNLGLKNSSARQLSVLAEANSLRVQQSFLATIFSDVLHKPMPKEVQALGEVEYSGDILYQRDNALIGLAANSGSLKGMLTTALGPLDADVKLSDNNITANLASKAFKPALLREGKFIPSFIDFKLAANTSLIPGSQMFAGSNWGLGNTDADVTINAVTINNQTYKNLHAIANYAHPSVKLHFTADDAAAKFMADLSTQLTSADPFATLPDAVNFNVDVAHLSPAQLHLTNRFGNGTIAMKAAGNLASLDLDNLQGDIVISNFTLSGDNGSTLPFTVSNLALKTEPAKTGNHVQLRSDFADLDYVGPVHPQKLKEIAKNIYENVQNGVFNEAKSASTLTNAVASQNLQPVDKTVNFIVALKDAEFLNRLLGIKANYRGTIQAQGSASDDGNHLTLACTAPTLTFGKFSVSDISLFVRSEDGSFNVLGKGRKTLKNGDVRVELTAINREGRIYTDIEWDESTRHAFFGKLSAVSNIEMPSATGSSTSALSPIDNANTSATANSPIAEASDTKKFGITTEFMPSQVCIGDSMWQFAQSRIDYHNDRITIDNFGIYNSTQRLTINGKYDRTFEDAITVDLNNVDLDYVLAFVNMNVVEFSGHATGKIFVKALPNGDPWARAEVNVPDLLFNHAKFGNADVILGWDHAERDIVIDGNIIEEGIGYTKVKGYVDPVNRDLDLHTESKNTQLAFLNKYTDGIFSNISGRATGNCRIYGGFQTIEFSGHEVGNAEATIPVTGVTYRVTDADVDIIPDMFSIKSAKIYDKYYGEGIASGELMHTHIKDMRYDFVLSGTNLRLYDKPRELDMPFFATATGSGKVHLHGKPGVMNAEMQIQTSAGSELTYILDSPDADVSQLLTFHDVTPIDSDTISTLLPIQMLDNDEKLTAATPAPAPATAGVTATPSTPTTTDINLYFEVAVEDGSCLHLITDDKSGDVITVYGNGPIQANYHNKSGFTMYGTYNISRGSYNLNIPSLAQRRKFEILDGGQVNFSGDPANADVKVKAQYVVNSASLADLNIGTGFANNTTRVNCLANIYGEVANMQFDLGLELPNCSQDEQQMVNNLIASDEDRTMQVLYLLGVGRFYAYNWNATDIAQSQSVLMMNSLLSSTLSSQLNNIISDALGSSNWTFGTNISTGQLGWSDMEVEGLVSSRLLNNRLLLNGNFGYSERQAATTNFVGDFDMQYLITPKGTVSIKAYSETNDRYFTKSTLTTQGVGLQLKKDFTRFINLFRRRKNE